MAKSNVNFFKKVVLMEPSISELIENACALDIGSDQFKEEILSSEKSCVSHHCDTCVCDGCAGCVTNITNY